MKEPALEVEALSVNYGRTPVLWDINLTLPQGMLIGILGPNGAGKSTFLKSLLGLVPILSGNVAFFGLPLKKARRRVSYVPQRSSVDWDFPITAFELVLMGRYGRLGLFKWPRAADIKAVEEALDHVGMANFAHRQISELSGGQQQRLFIARALLQEADLYLMDEPFAGVDMASEKEIFQLLVQLKKQGKTVCVVHHDLAHVETYFDWVILLNTCLIAAGPVSEVFHAETISRTYGQSAALLDEAIKLTKNKTSGLS